MLLVTSAGTPASIWNVPYETTWQPTPHVTLEGHTQHVNGGAFLCDESHVITGSNDATLRIWRTSDGMQPAKYKCGYVRHSFIY